MQKEIYIPSNLNLEKLLESKMPLLTHMGFKNDKRLQDKIAYLCSCIHNALSNRLDDLEDFIENKSDKRPYAVLNATLLQDVIHDYSKIIYLCIELGIIIKINSYEVGVESKKYLFTDTYFGVSYEKYSITTHTLEKSIKRSMMKHYRTQKKKHPSFLRKYWESGKLKIDIKSAMKWVNLNMQNELKLHEAEFALLNHVPENNDATTMSIQKRKEIHQKIIIEKYSLYKSNLFKLNHTNAYNYLFHFDSKGGRLYTRLTNLKKSFRFFLNYDGKTLHSVDLKNSQPYLILGLLNTTMWEEGKFEKKFKRGDYYREYERREVLEGIIILLKNAKNQYSSELDFKLFEHLAINGLLYDYIIENLGEQFASLNDRQNVKALFLQFMYHNSNAQWEGLPEINALKKMFPSINKLLNSLKKYDYKAISIILQSFERYLIIDDICVRIRKISPNITTLFTIHDSIATTTEYLPLVKSVMNDVFTIATGYAPTLDEETWSIERLEKNIDKYTIKGDKPKLLVAS